MICTGILLVILSQANIVASATQEKSQFFNRASLSKESLKVDKKDSPNDVGINICYEDFWKIYYCQDGYICCTPGSPTSKCCPETHPLCIDDKYCCASGHPKVCHDKSCCESDSYCCDDGNCCKKKSRAVATNNAVHQAIHAVVPEKRNHVVMITQKRVVMEGMVALNLVLHPLMLSVASRPQLHYLTTPLN